MVKKTRRKRSAAKRVKTAKHRNSKRSKRERGRGHGRGGRTTKRGGMPLASRVASRVASAAVSSPVLRNGPPALVHNVISGRNPDPREGALAIEGRRYYRLPSDMPPPSTKEQAYKEYEEKTNPVDLLSTADSVFSAAHKAKYNEQLHAQIEANQTPARTQTRNLFYTPGKQGNSYKDASIIPQPTFSTPFGPSSELSSPPPPDLFVEGKTKPITESPSFRRGFAPTIKNPNPTDPAQRLDFLLGEEEVDNPNKYQTPNSSPYKVSNKSTQKGFDKKKLGDTISSPTRPPFRI